MAERIGGFFLAAAVVAASVLVPFGILRFAYDKSFFFGLSLESFMCYQILAVKSLKDESGRVYQALKEQGLSAGRAAVSRIVGRDTQNQIGRASCRERVLSHV